MEAPGTPPPEAEDGGPGDPGRGITHDFNNILASIAINAGLAVEDSPPGSRMRRYLDMVLEGANRGRDLVKQVIAFSRQKEQERKPVRIAPIIEEGLKFLRVSIPTNIEISESVEKESDVVLADPIQIY